MADFHHSNDAQSQLPVYLQQWPGLYMRQGDSIVEALDEDINVAKKYPLTDAKGVVVGGRRITIMCAKDRYHVNEEVRVIHVLEVLEGGQEIYIMGPKTVTGEYVDGQEILTKNNLQQGYDGRVLNSPGVDYNYDITTYLFDSPGRHEIYWQQGDLTSNTLVLQIIGDAE